MNFRGIKVLVCDGYVRQIPAILKNLHKLGCFITTINESILDCGSTSRYKHKKIIVSGIKNNKTLYEKIILNEIYSSKYDVVIPITDLSTDIITINQNELRKYVKVAAAPYEAFKLAYDKQETMRICMENDIPCPITKMDWETMDEYLEKVSFPLALKPRKGTGSIGFRKVDTREKLNALISEGKIVPEQYIIQEYIEQTEQQICAYVFMDKTHQAINSCAVAKVHWYPIDGGSGCLIETLHRPDLIDFSNKLLTQMKWQGFAHVTFIIDPRNMMPKVLEINGRFPASTKLCFILGWNIICQMIEMAYDLPITSYPQNQKEGIRMRYSQTDILFFLKSPDRWKNKWSKPRGSRTIDYIFDVTDPLPYFSYTLKMIIKSKSEFKKRKR